VNLTFLGTGTSFGVPVIGCECSVCTSDDVRNQRLRHALLVEREGRRLLVDTPPELRLQLVRAGVRSVEAVFLSHPHADHVHGIDDLRIFSLRAGQPLPLYVAGEYEDEVTRRFAYIWDTPNADAEWAPVPQLALNTFEDRDTLEVCGTRLVPIAFPHGGYGSYGFRMDDLAVIVDGKRVPEDAVPLFEGVRVLVINALWFGNPHPSHFNVEEAIETAQRLGVQRTYLTHLSHRLDHEILESRLPEGVRAAHDRLTIEI
jgi:phosphoribosyl 1,2-cyclic phosphate phosphodiesterase